MTVWDDNQPGASDAAAGLVNPFTGRRAKPAWRWKDALIALHGMLEAVGRPDLFRDHGVLRPAVSPKQADAFASRAASVPDSLAWLSAQDAHERFPAVASPHGALWIPAGGSVVIPALVAALLDDAVRHGAHVERRHLTEWSISGSGIALTAADSTTRRASCTVLSLGAGVWAFEALRALPLNGVKGQTVTLETPSSLRDQLPGVAGKRYLAPVTSETLVAGATFEHEFENARPSRAVSLRLRERVARLVPALGSAPIRSEQAGIRVTVPSAHSPRRLPRVGPVPTKPRLWLFTGLGAKGLLTAPLLAPTLTDWIHNPETLPRALRL